MCQKLCYTWTPSLDCQQLSHSFLLLHKLLTTDVLTYKSKVLTFAPETLSPPSWHDKFSYLCSVNWSISFLPFDPIFRHFSSIRRLCSSYASCWYTWLNSSSAQRLNSTCELYLQSSVLLYNCECRIFGLFWTQQEKSPFSVLLLYIFWLISTNAGELYR